MCHCSELKELPLESEFFSHFCWKANAVISYNNRPASEAVPYFEQVTMLLNLYCTIAFLG